jgi:methyl-accepting chemotaxis protein
MTGAGQVAQASQDLARRTESGAASLEQTGAALQQVDSTVHSSARNAQDSVDRAGEALQVVAAGREMIDAAVATMEHVLASAQDIDHVIEALDKIAFQTRVLAMNAAVEAGRAGEAGKGFAVVADLVSALAGRAEEEARHARAQLTVTRDGITSAVEAVGRTNGSFAAIVQNVQGVQDMLADIARASGEQAAALTEVNSAVSSMAEVTQATAAMVEETAAASAEMMAQIRELETELSQVRWSGEGAARTATRSPAPDRAYPGGGTGAEALIAYDRRRANTGYRVVLNESPTGPLN